jgi:SAM-dependent methyltransferase
MKVLNYYNCGSERRTFYAEENEFSLVKCDKCGLLYLEERPDDSEITQAHKQGKHRGLQEFDITGSFSERKIIRYMDVLDDIFKGDLSNLKTWLDVGCGHGEFIAAIQDYSNGKITVRGTEPNIHKQESARKKGLNVSYFDLESHDDKYDVISILNVYSHLPYPPEFLTLLKKHLNPKGEIIIETGNSAHLPAKDHYRPFYLPNHLSFASEDIVVGILKRLEFEVLSVNKYPYPFLPKSDLKSVLKEVVKVVLPGYKSRILEYKKMKLYSQTDMFIRARLKS